MNAVALTLVLAPAYGAVALTSGRWAFAVYCGVASIALLSSARTYFALRIELDSEGLKTAGFGEAHAIWWRDVRAVSLPGGGIGPALRIDTDERSVSIPIRWFDLQRLEASLRRHVPAAAFEPGARLRIPRIERERAERRSMNESRVAPLRVDSWASVILGLAVPALVAAVILCFLSSDWRLTPFFLVFLAFDLFVYFRTGSVEADNSSVRLRTPFARYEIAWRDIRRIRHDRGAQGREWFSKAMATRASSSSDPSTGDMVEPRCWPSSSPRRSWKAFPSSDPEAASGVRLEGPAWRAAMSDRTTRDDRRSRGDLDSGSGAFDAEPRAPAC